MGEVIQLTPTINFTHAPMPSIVHLPVPEDAVVTGRDVTIVTTLCGFVGLGAVKNRRGANCGECLSLAEHLHSYT